MEHERKSFTLCTCVSPVWHDTQRVIGTLKFIVFVCELPGGYKAVFILILFGKYVLHHVLVQGVVGGVAVTLELFPQVFFDLADEV